MTASHGRTASLGPVQRQVPARSQRARVDKTSIPKVRIRLFGRPLGAGPDDLSPDRPGTGLPERGTMPIVHGLDFPLILFFSFYTTHLAE